MDRRSFLAASAGAGAGLLALAGCLGGPDRELPATPTGAWRQRASDPHNSGSAPVAVPPRGTPAWDAGEAHTAAPVVADGVVYSVGDEATALDARTGDRRWEADLPADARHEPALVPAGDAASDSGGTGRAPLLLVGADRQLVALSADTGDRAWSVAFRRRIDGPVTADPDRGLAVVPVAETGLVAVEFGPDDGAIRWVDPAPAARAAAVDDAVYVTAFGPEDDGGRLRALSPADGEPRWERSLRHPDAPPVVADRGLLVADGGTLALYDPGDGRRRRTLGSFGERVPVLPAVAGGRAFVADDRGGLAAVSIADGSTAWEREVQVTVDTGIAVGRDAVVTAVSDLPGEALPGVAAFERADGSLRWSHPIEGFDVAVSTPPVVADGAVFYASNESLGVVALGDLPPQTDAE